MARHSIEKYSAIQYSTEDSGTVSYVPAQGSSLQSSVMKLVAVKLRTAQVSKI